MTTLEKNSIDIPFLKCGSINSKISDAYPTISNYWCPNWSNLSLELTSNQYNKITETGNK